VWDGCGIGTIQERKDVHDECSQLVLASVAVNYLPERDAMRYSISAAVIALLFLILSNSLAASAQTNKSDFPTDEEVNLLVEQVDRAMNQYHAVVEQEKALLGSSADTSTDAQLLKFWAIVKAEFVKRPQKFNSFAGFDFATMVDDASRNAALISNSAATEVLREVTGGKVTPKTDSLVTLMQNANSAGTLLFTVSESATALYRKFLRWQGDTLNESVLALTDCSDALKKPNKN
jgi:hypothetical protein